MLLVSTLIGPSAIHGYGLFAAEPIARGTRVWAFHPALDLVVPEAEVAGLPAVAQAYFRNYAYRPLAEEGVWYLNGDYAKFMNHAAEPNLTEVDGCNLALRDIAVGEELTCDYFQFDRDAPHKLGVGLAIG
jgi:uncharacterized protein